MREIRTSGSMSGEGKRGRPLLWDEYPRRSSTLLNGVHFSVAQPFRAGCWAEFVWSPLHPNAGSAGFRERLQPWLPMAKAPLEKGR